MQHSVNCHPFDMYLLFLLFLKGFFSAICVPWCLIFKCDCPVAQSVHKTKKIEKDEIRRVIHALCSKRYLTLGVLGTLLARKTDYLRNHHLNPMVKAATLRRAFPKVPSDPRQAYTSSEK